MHVEQSPVWHDIVDNELQWHAPGMLHLSRVVSCELVPVALPATRDDQTAAYEEAKDEDNLTNYQLSLLVVQVLLAEVLTYLRQHEHQDDEAQDADEAKENNRTNVKKHCRLIVLKRAL